MIVRLTLSFSGRVALFMRPPPPTTFQYRRTRSEHLGNLATQPCRPWHFLAFFPRKDVGRNVEVLNKETESTTLPDRNGTPAFDHPQGVAFRAMGLATQLIHERPHQENTPAAHAQLPGVHVRDGIQIKRFSFIHQ